MPIQYITHVQEFMGLEFYVDENVLIPQPDTEVVVETAIQFINDSNTEICILDLCTGSGCIGISIAKNIKNARVVLSDIQEKSLAIAQKNAIQNKVEKNIKMVQSNLFEKLKNYQFDTIVSNPPYIETSEIATLSKEVQQEPKIALDGGEDGLFFYNKILKEASSYLKSKGYLVLEIGYNQANAILKIAEQTKKWKIVTLQAIKDLGGNDRVLVFQKN